MEDRLSRTKCERGNDLISFLYGEADERETRDFEHHLQNCSECKVELGAFRQLRESVVAWRQESLTAVPAYSVDSRSALGQPRFRSDEPETPSVGAAIRAFFGLSPLWARGALVFAAVLFCVVSIMAIASLLRKPQPGLAATDKVYSELELQARIEQSVQAKLEAQRKEHAEPANPTIATSTKGQTVPRSGVAERLSKRVGNQPGAQRRPLTRAEREQLAADLRLVSADDEADLDLVSDKINN